MGCGASSRSLGLRIRELRDQPHIEDVLTGIIKDGDDAAVGRGGDEVWMTV
jgi:hypothetical protein